MGNATKLIRALLISDMPKGIKGFQKGYKQTKAHHEKWRISHLRNFNENPNYGMKGKRHSLETKKKIGKNNARVWLGKHLSAKTRKKISLAKKGKYTGSAASNWRGGVMKDPEHLREVNRMWSRRRRATIRNVSGGHSIGEWLNLKAQYDWKCASCGLCEPKIRLTEDHIIPLSKGGSDNIENIQPLCKSCNCKKHTRIIRFVN